MATIKVAEDYCSFETAKLLKEKGFDQNCATYYLDGQVWHHHYGEVIPKDKQIYAVPTQAIAMKWLREVHNKFINLGITPVPEGWYYIIENIKDWRGAGTFIDTHLGDNKRFNSYEQAAEAAIKYCLENLI